MADNVERSSSARVCFVPPPSPNLGPDRRFLSGIWWEFSVSSTEFVIFRFNLLSWSFVWNLGHWLWVCSVLFDIGQDWFHITQIRWNYCSFMRKDCSLWWGICVSCFGWLILCVCWHVWNWQRLSGSIDWLYGVFFEIDKVNFICPKYFDFMKKCWSLWWWAFVLVWITS